jgi:hypothetical protein
VADTRDTEIPARERPVRHPVARLLRGAGWLVFFLLVASVSYVLLVLAGH